MRYLALVAAVAVCGANVVVAQTNYPGRVAAAEREPLAPRSRVERPELTLWSPDAERFDASDYATVFFSVDRPAYVTVFEVGTDGKVRVLFPRTPRDARLVEADRSYRVMAGAYFYPTGPTNQQIPYVFALASETPFDLSAFGNGNRWQYQLTGGVRSADPEFTIDRIGRLLASPDQQDEVVADYIYFATRSQYRQFAAMNAYDACSRNGSLGYSPMDLSAWRGSDYFFRTIIVPLWNLTMPFVGGGFYYGTNLYPSCGRTTIFAYQPTTVVQGTASRPASPTVTPPAYPPRPTTDDGLQPRRKPRPTGGETSEETATREPVMAVRNPRVITRTTDYDANVPVRRETNEAPRSEPIANDRVTLHRRIVTERANDDQNWRRMREETRTEPGVPEMAEHRARSVTRESAPASSSGSSSGSSSSGGSSAGSSSSAPRESAPRPANAVRSAKDPNG